MKLTKTELNKLLVEERKKSRDKQKSSEFMRRTYSIFSGQKIRAKEDFNIVLSYTVEDLREWLKPFVDTICKCGKKLTMKQIAVDHVYPVSRGGEWTIANLAAICKSCNLRKGKMLPDEFVLLEAFVEKTLSAESRADFWARLATGGKFHNGK